MGEKDSSKQAPLIKIPLLWYDVSLATNGTTIGSGYSSEIVSDTSNSGVIDVNPGLIWNPYYFL